MYNKSRKSNNSVLVFVGTLLQWLCVSGRFFESEMAGISDGRSSEQQAPISKFLLLNDKFDRSTSFREVQGFTCCNFWDHRKDIGRGEVGRSQCLTEVVSKTYLKLVAWERNHFVSLDAYIKSSKRGSAKAENEEH
jgi:hypothetical protein